MLSTYHPSQRPPSARVRFHPWFLPSGFRRKENLLVGEKWIRHQQRRKKLVTAIWCLAFSIAAIGIALLVSPS